ncbi:MAG: ABC transporter permease [Clostridia bacterium]|nr:ABC transporter permease [Clostridia bacterium]
MTSFTSPKDMPDLEKIGDKIYVDSFLTGLAQGLSVKNDISDNYLKYLNEMDKSWYSAIQYSYGTNYSDTLFTSVNAGITEDAKETKYMSLSELKAFYINELNTYAPQYSSLVPFANFFGNIITKMPGSSDLSDENCGKYVLSQYDVVKGTFPTSASEAVLVVGPNNEITDLTLAQLGLLDEPEFLSLFKLGVGEDNDATKDDYMTIAFENALNKEYVLYHNDAVYTPNAGYNPMDAESYPFIYSGSRSSLDVAEGEGTKIKVVGILRLKDDLTYGCLSPGLNITEAVIENYIAANKQSKIVEFINNEQNCIKREVEGVTYTVYLHVPAKKFDKNYTQTIDIPIGPNSIKVKAAVDDTTIRYLGGVDKPNQISIYAKDFDGKEKLLNYLDQWNDWCTSDGSYNGVELKDANKVTYSDTVGLLMGMMQTMLDVITIVLVAFTAISLVVSSVMIGIITYVSVVERVKEIGVLRSLGARKQDIRNLFNAETFIIGLAAGLIGIIVTYLLSIGVNAIIFAFSGIAGIAALPPLTAFIMVCVSVFLTLISGLIPAQAAAKKDPVIALRTE